MGFIFDGVSSSEMGIPSRMSVQNRIPDIRNNTDKLAGRHGIMDFGETISERKIEITCLIPPGLNDHQLLDKKDSIVGYIKNQAEIRIDNKAYKIKTVTDNKEHGSAKTTHVYAEELYYDLARAARLESTVFDTAKAVTPMKFALQNMVWDIGTIEINSAKSFESTEENPLALLQLIADIYHGELVFDSIRKTVSLLKKTGRDRGILFHFRKNMKSIQRVVSTSSLITKLYAAGKGGMTFASINDGKSYVEDYSYTDEILVGSLDCSNFTDASDMLSYAKMRVADYCKPNYSYKLSVLYLSGLTGYAHETYGLGDTVRVMDEELELDITTRIVRMEKNIQEPWNTVVELSTTIGTLSLENDASVQEAIDSVIKSFIAPRLIQATINTQKGEVNAMYELGVPVKYIYRETEDGIVFTHPDGQICEIKVI